MSAAPPPGVERDYPLARLTTVRTGGPADFFARPSELGALVEILRWAGAEGVADAIAAPRWVLASAGFDTWTAAGPPAVMLERHSPVACSRRRL